MPTGPKPRTDVYRAAPVEFRKVLGREVRVGTDLLAYGVVTAIDPVESIARGACFDSGTIIVLSPDFGYTLNPRSKEQP